LSSDKTEDLFMSRPIRTVAFTSLIALVLAACGSSDSEGAADTVAPAAAPTVTEAPPASAAPVDSTAPAASDAPADSTGPAGPVAERIVSLSPSATEMLFAIGAGDQVVAVDDQSNYPAEAQAKQTDLSGYTPNVEAIAAYEPDLVIHDGTTDLATQLEPLGIADWVGAAPLSFDDVYTQIEQLGVATGHVAEAAVLVGEMQTDIDAAIAAISPAAEPITYYHELDDTLFSVTSNTFIGQVYELFGLRNIADGAEGGTDYPQLSAEFIISQNPDLIFLADTKCCGQSPDTVGAREGWSTITAVTQGHVITLDDDIVSRWGPRLVDFVQSISGAVAGVGAAG
jgi:iron complex transport system substrate-binding protein